MSPSPPTEKTITVFVDDESGKFGVEPSDCEIAVSGLLTFTTEGQTYARVVIPDASVAWEEGSGPGQPGEVIALEINPTHRNRYVRVQSDPDKLPYAIFQLDAEGSVIGELERAPVIIIVKADQ